MDRLRPRPALPPGPHLHMQVCPGLQEGMEGRGSCREGTHSDPYSSKALPSLLIFSLFLISLLRAKTIGQVGQSFVCISGLIKVTEAVLQSKPEHMTLQFDYLRKARIIGLGIVSF